MNYFIRPTAYEKILGQLIMGDFAVSTQVEQNVMSAGPKRLNT